MIKMKENITDIMNKLQIGQIIIMDGKKYAFVEAKKSRAAVCNLENKKEYLIKGYVEVTPEKDQDTIDRVEEEAVQAYMQERKVKKMIAGQKFIGQDDKEYEVKKINRATVDCTAISTGIEYRAKFAFVKNIL